MWSVKTWTIDESIFIVEREKKVLKMIPILDAQLWLLLFDYKHFFFRRK